MTIIEKSLRIIYCFFVTVFVYEEFFCRPPYVYQKNFPKKHTPKTFELKKLCRTKQSLFYENVIILNFCRKNQDFYKMNVLKFVLWALQAASTRSVPVLFFFGRRSFHFEPTYFSLKFFFSSRPSWGSQDFAKCSWYPLITFLEAQ